MINKADAYSFGEKHNVDKKSVDYLLKYKNYESFIEFKKDIKKIEKKYPLQYLVGSSNFFGRDFEVNEKVLIPRFETELLVEKTINYITKHFHKKQIFIADICSGTGCIGITLKQEIKNSKVIAVEKYSSAFKILEENNNKYKKKVKLLKGNLLKPLLNEKFDVIVSNPPYVSYEEEIMESVKKYEPQQALYAPNNGLYFYEEMLKNISKNLKRKSFIAFEIGMSQALDIKTLVLKYLPKAKIKIEKDYNNRDRFIFIFNNLYKN